MPAKAVTLAPGSISWAMLYAHANTIARIGSGTHGLMTWWRLSLMIAIFGGSIQVTAMISSWLKGFSE
jgi:hypothetical protein